ncbi:hypothetical protein NHP21005_15540 [Helicobacter sp. NHP21005]|uniref:hypothetical protein n=1 Tax=Helicobacter felistomachi TaxID=3040201 RepID=UPI0025725754|nr:hypothetical protein [Helicobacter sp. NHP21005]BEG57866.1 hypothetical protein NHP21005_15540 [Helicobacter sp. NHP21005]
MTKADKNSVVRQIHNQQELMQKMQRMHEIQTQLEKAGIIDLVHEFMGIREQINMLFEKPKRIRRTKAQMQAEREKIQRKQENV